MIQAEDFIEAAQSFKKKDFKNAEIVSDNSIAFPVGPHLKQDHILKISKIINHTLKKYD